MGAHVATIAQLIFGEHVFSILTIRGIFVPLASLPGLPTLKKRWPMQAVALSLVQKSSLKNLVQLVCVYSFDSRSLLTLDGKMFR